MTINNPTESPSPETNLTGLEKEVLNLVNAVNSLNLEDIHSILSRNNDDTLLSLAFGQAVTQGYLIAVGYFIEVLEISVNQLLANGLSALYIAAKEGHEEVVNLLLEAGAEVNQLVPNGRSVLHVAAMEGRNEVIKLLLQAGAEADFLSRESRYTALHFATMKGHNEVVKSLLQAGADANLLSKQSVSPLHFAVLAKNKEITRLLLKAKADANLLLADGLTPFIVAVLQEDKEIIELLLNHLIEIGQLYLALLMVYEYHNPDALKLLPGYLKDKQLYYVIFEALNDNRQFAISLLNNINEAQLYSIVFTASCNGNKKIIELLFEYRYFDINQLEEESGFSALHLATLNNHKEVVVFLLKNNANVNLLSRDDRSALLIATLNESAGTIALLLEYKADVNLITDKGFSAFHTAAFNGHLGTMRLLLAAGAEVDLLSSISGATALHIAVDDRRLEAARLLIDHGASINKLNKKEQTALHIATNKMYPEIINLLLDRGAQDSEDEDGKTARDYLNIYYNLSLLSALLKNDYNEAKKLPNIQVARMVNDLIVNDAGGGGNCFYHVISRQLSLLGININHEELRSLAIKEMTNNPEQYQILINYADFHSYINEHRRLGTYAEGGIIEALANVILRDHNISIEITYDQPEDSDYKTTTLTEKGEKGTIRILYNASILHYLSLESPEGYGNNIELENENLEPAELLQNNLNDNNKEDKTIGKKRSRDEEDSSGDWLKEELAYINKRGYDHPFEPLPPLLRFDSPSFQDEIEKMSLDYYKNQLNENLEPAELLQDNLSEENTHLDNNNEVTTNLNQNFSYFRDEAIDNQLVPMPLPLSLTFPAGNNTQTPCNVSNEVEDPNSSNALGVIDFNIDPQMHYS